MTPALASWVVKERFGANIKPETIRMASDKESSKEAVQDPAKKGRACIFPGRSRRDWWRLWSCYTPALLPFMSSNRS
jgi:hypothetical protein